MEEDLLFTLQLFTPGSDIAVGFRPSQSIFGRTGNDVLLGFQPPTSTPGQAQFDVLFGDFPAVIEDPAAREWSDTFILGDWNRPYYANGIPTSLGLNDFALIPDFNPALDAIQLYGEASDYQLLSIGIGSAIAYQGATGLDIIGVLFGASGLSLEESYFQFRGITPPPGPALSQVQQFGTSEFDIPLSISTDPSGNVYIAGGTTGSLAGANAGLRDNFVSKYDSQGNLLFTQQFGTSGFETIYGIDTDNQGNYYITGVTDSNSGFAGPQQADLLDTFVAKYDSSGTQQWIRQIGQNIIFNAFNIDVDPDTGDVFISGANVRSSLENPDDAFVIKFDTDGNQQWFTETGTSGFLNFDETYGLTVANDGSVYATGWTVGNLGGINAGLYDNWIAKYDNATGEQQWVVQYGTPDYEWSWDVRTDSSGNVYTAGWTLGSLGGTNAGSYDSYLTKYDSSGNQLWIRQFGTAGDDEAYSLYIDETDNIFVGGYTDGSLGGTNAGSFDPWVAQYDTDGNQIWITQFGTSDRDELYGLTGDAEGNLYVTGITQGSFGALNAGSFDGWTAKLDAASGTLLNFNGTLDGAGEQNTFEIAAGDTLSILNFTGVGTGVSPSAATIAEVDTLKFEGTGLTARNMILTQENGDLVISFDGVSSTTVRLKNFKLENLDNLQKATGASVNVSNIVFDGQTTGNDSFDVVDANWSGSRIFNRNSVTFLNDLNNIVKGFDNSNDVINGQGGNDTLYGLSGDDVLRGGDGNDRLYGGKGRNILEGGNGADTFYLELGGTQTITDFTASEGDRIGLSGGLGFGRLSITQGMGLDASNTLIRVSSSNELLAIVNGVQANIVRSAFA